MTGKELIELIKTNEFEDYDLVFVTDKECLDVVGNTNTNLSLSQSRAYTKIDLDCSLAKAHVKSGIDDDTMPEVLQKKAYLNLNH